MPEIITPLLAKCNGAGRVDLIAVIAPKLYSQRHLLNTLVVLAKTREGSDD